MKTKNLLLGTLSFVIIAAITIMVAGQSSAAVNTPTQLGIRTGLLSFYKDTTTSMDSYFSHSGNQSSTIDLGTYDADLSPIPASSSGDHRFTVSDMKGSSFYITVVSSDLNGVTNTGAAIPATAVGYTGTNWMGTGKSLTINPTSNADISTEQNFVGRLNASGLSKYSQEITLKVTIPAAQTPDTYTGSLTFTIY